MRNYLPIILIVFLFCCACQKPGNTFNADLRFLNKHDSVIVLSADNSKIIISPKYQGKVFTSTTDGSNSLGWINYKAFDGEVNPHMNAYGGENRLWLGPEGNRFSLFFEKDQKQVFENWHTPAAFDNEPWTLDSKNAVTAKLSKKMELVNYAGSRFSVLITRSISIMNNNGIEKIINISSAPVQAVGYYTDNTIANMGTEEWTEKTGAPCIWMLDMFPPSATIVIPFHPGVAHPVTSNYFGEVTPDRIRIKDSVLFFKADGKARGKLGINPLAAKDHVASYDSEHKILTLVIFDMDRNGKYLNQEWNSTKPPYSGDAVNAYNDGPLADGTQMGPFYELESVSPAAFLKPNGSMSYRHTVMHFTGSEESLNAIAMATLGVTIQQIKSAL